MTPQSIIDLLEFIENEYVAERSPAVALIKSPVFTLKLLRQLLGDITVKYKVESLREIKEKYGIDTLRTEIRVVIMEQKKLLT